MNRIDKTNRFRTFKKKHSKDENVREVLDYISLMEDQIVVLEKMVMALENLVVKDSEDSQN